MVGRVAPRAPAQEETNSMNSRAVTMTTPANRFNSSRSRSPVTGYELTAAARMRSSSDNGSRRHGLPPHKGGQQSGVPRGEAEFEPEFFGDLIQDILRGADDGSGARWRNAECRVQSAQCRPFCILHFAFCILHFAFENSAACTVGGQ